MATETKTRKLYVRDYDTREVVGTVDVTGKSSHSVDRVMMGMLVNINTEKCFIDDSECDDLD